MRDLSLGRLSPAVCVLCLVASAAAPAAAQTAAPPVAAPPASAPAPAAAPPLAAPPPAPPGAAPAAAPPAYAYPPPPPGYGYPPPAYGAYPTYPAPQRPPESVPWDGGPVPQGFHVEERPRKGLVIAGSIVLGVPWVLGVTFAGGASPSFQNQTGWLVIPALGPWLTLATRSKSNNCNTTSSSINDYCNDSDDSAVRTLLVFDGLTQAAGTIMLIVGLASPKKVVTRDFIGSLHWAPAPVGKTGYGGFVSGEF